MSARVVVLGGGPNGLTAAGLLAKAGLKPLLLEARAEVGGAAATAEIHPGFRAPVCAHTTGPFRASVLEALGVTGVELVRPEPRVVLLHGESGALPLFGDPARTADALRPLSAADARAWPALDATLRHLGRLAAAVCDTVPPELGEPQWSDAVPIGRLGLSLVRLGRGDGQRLLRYAPMAVADFAAEWLESEPARTALCALALTRVLAGPGSAGTTANLLLQAAAGDGSAAGEAVFVKGGPGALTAALAARVQALGGEIRTGARVARLALGGGRVVGVVLDSGEEIACQAVLSSADPHTTFLRLLAPEALDPDDRERLACFRTAGMVSKLNLALDGLPQVRGLAPEHATARLLLADSVESLERAYDDAKYGAPSRQPLLEVALPSLHDPALAPAGKHVMSVHVQFTPYRLREGDWDAQRDALAERVLDTLERRMPGLRARVLARQLLTPLDMEREWGLTGGHPMHGEMSLNQLFVGRPLIGFSRYRTPVPGLYLCGAGAHPGGGVTGWPGANAARVAIADLRER